MSPWPNVTRFIDRHGHERWRWRKLGYPTVTLHGEPGSPQFMADMERARQSAPLAVGKHKVGPGTFAALCVEYYQSAAWRALGPITQATYRGELERFRAKAGHVPIRLMRRQDVLRFMDEKAATPSAANNLLKVLRLVMRYALDRDQIAADPTYKVRKAKIQTDGFTAWPESAIAAYEARWPSGTRQRLALALLLHTGQRRGDVVRLGRQHIKDGRLRFKQSKTGNELSIAVTPELRAETRSGAEGSDDVPSDRLRGPVHGGRIRQLVPRPMRGGRARRRADGARTAQGEGPAVGRERLHSA